MPVIAATWYLVPATAIGLWVAWTDMKYMKIPNRAVMALLAVFLGLAPFVLPWEMVGWGLVLGAIILVIGFLTNMVGLVGAGDAKFAAAMAPFFVGGDLRVILALFAACLLAAFVAHRGARAIPAVRRLAPTWESWTRRDFPMGLALSGTLIFYLLGSVALAAT